MQTTLRIDDQLYREAKAEAARQGISLTRFLEGALQMRLGRARPSPTGTPHHFPVYRPEQPPTLSNAELRRIAEEEQEEHDLAKLAMDQKGT